MKKAFIGLFFAFALVLSACTQESATTTTEPSPTPVAVVATPAPTPTPVDYVGGLLTAKSGLEKALTDYKAKDYAAAVESLDGAHKGLTALTASAPVLLKSGLETASKGIESAKGLVEKKDKGAEKTLTGLIASVTKLADTAKTADGGLAGAAGSMVKDTAGATGTPAKEAAAGAGAATKGAAEKAKPAEKK